MLLVRRKNQNHSLFLGKGDSLLKHFHDPYDGPETLMVESSVQKSAWEHIWLLIDEATNLCAQSS